MLDAGWDKGAVFGVGHGVVAGGQPFLGGADPRVTTGLAALHLLPAGFSTAAIPWVVFTGPEVAQVGLTEPQAAATLPGARVAYLPVREADRAVTAGRTEGFVKIIAGPRRVLRDTGGGQVVGPPSWPPAPGR